MGGPSLVAQFPQVRSPRSSPSHPILSYPVSSSYYVISYPILSRLIISYPILSSGALVSLLAGPFQKSVRSVTVSSYQLLDTSAKEAPLRE